VKPTTVAFVIATLDRAGAETQMVRLAKGLDRSRFAPVVIALTRSGPLEEELRNAGIDVHVIGKRRKIAPLAARRLTRLLRRIAPGIVHTWLFTANTYGRHSALAARVPVIVASERCVDPWKLAFHRAIDRHYATRTSAVIANANAVKLFLVAEGIPEEKVHVIRNGFDFETLARFGNALDNPPKAEGPYTIGTVARLEPQKGLGYLLEAFAKLKNRGIDALLEIVGRGPDSARIMRQAAKLGIRGDVTLLGYRPQPALAVVTWDLFVSSSLWEGLPNTVMEAMALGVPVVATDAGGTRELVRPGETGLLTKPADATALCEAMAEALQHMDESRRMAADARDFVKAGFPTAGMVAAYEELYQDLLEAKGALAGG